MVASAVFLLLGIAAAAYPAFEGSLAAFVVFNVAFIAMVLLALPAPVSYGYIFFSLMLFLGFWLKLMVHLLLGTSFGEPTGDFSGGRAGWDLALRIASMAALGISTARIVQLALSNRTKATERITCSIPAPGWYVGQRKAVWLVSVAAMLGVNLLNVQFAFYQIGVNPQLILQLHLNVLLAWAVSIGFALWFTVLVHWELTFRPAPGAGPVILALIEALASSISALSRSIYLFHTVPYLLTLATQHNIGAKVSARVLLSVLWISCLLISLASVSWLRINIYHFQYRPAPLAVLSESQTQRLSERANEADMSEWAVEMAKQVARLSVDRWIGLEGVLAVSASRNLNYELLWQAALENPKKGNDSIYQAIAKSPYQASEHFTFLTLPGLVAILFYSGSLVVVFAGAMLAVLVIIATERAVARYTANPFLCSMAALAIANVICQMNFPLLAGIFLLQLWLFIAFVWILSQPGIFRRPAGA